MNSKFTIEIPYDSRSKYINVVKEINKLIDKNGVFMIFINNMPYNPSSFLVIETNTNADKINEIINDNSLTIVPNRELEEFTYELAERKWDGTPLSNDFSIDLVFRYGFHFAEKVDLEQKGYGFCEPISRKQIFISYCHKDKAKVLEIVEDIKRSGLYIWVDVVEIDLGDSIIERVDSGIQSCEMSIVFMSKHTQTAMFARHELKILFSQYINSHKPWVIVKLDETKPEEVFVGLKDTKYFDYNGTPDVQLLIAGIKKKMSKIKE